MSFFNSVVLFCQIYQSWLDKSTPFYAVRWAATLLLTAIYMIRVYILQVGIVLSLHVTMTVKWKTTVKVKEGEAQSRKADGVSWKTTCLADSRQTQCEILSFMWLHATMLLSLFSPLACLFMFFYCYCTAFTGSTT